jgi:hypothetical protein
VYIWQWHKRMGPECVLWVIGTVVGWNLRWTSESSQSTAGSRNGRKPAIYGDIIQMHDCSCQMIVLVDLSGVGSGIVHRRKPNVNGAKGEPSLNQELGYQSDASHKAKKPQQSRRIPKHQDLVEITKHAGWSDMTCWC